MRRRGLLCLDASALVKLILIERESAALRRTASRARLAASELVLAEVPRALARAGAASAGDTRTGHEAQRVLGGLDLVPVTRSLLASSGTLGSPGLRTLDAIHVASALTLTSGLDAFVSYDRRQLEAAANAGMAILSPGAGAA